MTSRRLGLLPLLGWDAPPELSARDLQGVTQGLLVALRRRGLIELPLRERRRRAPSIVLAHPRGELDLAQPAPLAPSRDAFAKCDFRLHPPLLSTT